MAELEIEGSFEEQWGIVKSTLKQMHVTFHGNGQKGFVKEVQEFMSEWRGAEEARASEMKKIDRKWNLRVAIIAIIVTVVMGLLEMSAPAIRHSLGMLQSKIIETAQQSNKDFAY